MGSLLLEIQSGTAGGILLECFENLHISLLGKRLSSHLKFVFSCQCSRLGINCTQRQDTKYRGCESIGFEYLEVISFPIRMRHNSFLHNMLHQVCNANSHHSNLNEATLCLLFTYVFNISAKLSAITTIGLLLSEVHFCLH